MASKDKDIRGILGSLMAEDGNEIFPLKFKSKEWGPYLERSGWEDDGVRRADKWFANHDRGISKDSDGNMTAIGRGPDGGYIYESSPTTVSEDPNVSFERARRHQQFILENEDNPNLSEYDMQQLEAMREYLRRRTGS